MYYRTYVTTFTRSDGIHYYAGKRKSKFENPSEDPYFGSGIEVKNAVIKYSRDCIMSIDWFEHTESTYDQEEINLIHKMKLKYGNKCVKKSVGGSGGDTQKFSSNEEREHTSKLRSVVANRRWSDAEQRKSQSELMKKLHLDPEYKRKHLESCNRVQSTEEMRKLKSKIAKLKNSNPEMRKRVSDSCKKSKRTSVIWGMYNSGELTKLWNESGQLKCKKFTKWLDLNYGLSFSPSKVKKPVEQMIKDSNGIL